MSTSYREKIYKRYVDTYSQVYRKKDYLVEFSHRSALYELNYKTLLPQNKESKILELGSGPGYFLRYLLDKGYKNAFGVDVSGQQTESALQLGINNVAQCDLFGFLMNTSDTYDLICSFHVFEHLFKDEILNLLDLIYKKLNKNGVLFVEVPNAGSPLLGGQGRYGEFTHEVGFTPSSLKEILLITGFNNVDVFPAKGISSFARLFFGISNFFLHSRLSPDMVIEGEIIGLGYKKD